LNTLVCILATLTTPKSLIESTLEYSCLYTYNIKIENKKHTLQIWEIKTNIVVQRQRSHKNKQNKIKNMWK